MNENQIGDLIVEASISIHRKTGPGLLESVYETILAHQLQAEGLTVKRQVYMPIQYDQITFENGFRADLVIENKVIVELKCVELISNSHRKQLLTYLRMTGMRLGYLLNFNESLMKHGIYRTVNKLW